MQEKIWKFDKEILPIQKMENLILNNINYSYSNNTPYPHIVIDNMFEEKYLDWILDEFPDKNGIDWKSFGTTHEIKLASKNEEQIGFFTRYFIYLLNSSVFLKFLEKMTGIPNLIPDPYLVGGGLHQILKGGKLGVHVDFNKSEKLKANRKLNLLVYLNKNWKEEYGGHFELWDKDVKHCLKKVLPIYNRMVVFSTSNISYHGHPHPLTCPENMSRKSIALYYYANEEADIGNDEETIKKNKHDTLFRITATKSRNKETKIYTKLGYEEAHRCVLEYKKTGNFELKDVFDNEKINLKKTTFLNILQPKEIEMKNYLFAAFEDMDFDLACTQFEEINKFILNEYYKYGFIKGLAYYLKKEMDFDISLDTKIEKQPLISVLMPAYNDEDTIAYAMESVLKQTYKNIELIVIDDESSDRTSEIVKEIQKNDKRVKYVRQPNTGVAGARNRGLEEASGEYIKLCDSDDVLFPYALEMLVRALKFTNENQKFIFDDYCLYFPEDENLILKDMIKPSTKFEAYKIQLVGNVYPVGSVLIEKETLIKEGGFDPTLNGTDDYDLWNRLLVKYDFFKLEVTPLYLQFCYKAQLSADLETLRCYTDVSCLKFTNSLDFTKILSNKEIYMNTVYQMIRREDMCTNTIFNLNETFYKKELLTKKEKDTVLFDALKNNNELVLKHYENYVAIPTDYKYAEKNKVIKNFIASSFLRNKLHKISFFTEENEETYFDFYEYQKFYVQLKKEGQSDGNLILSSSWAYSVIPEIWVENLNTIMDRVIVPSEFIKNNYDNLGIVDDKIEVVGIPINSEFYCKKETNYALNTNKKFNFFCISKFTKSSGIDNLLKAYLEEFTKDDDVCLILMNDFVYDYDKKLEIENLINTNHNIPKIVIKENNFRKEELRDIYNSVDCYVYPYAIEKFGVHVAEAMACELPVIVTKHGATDDFCNENNSYQIEAELVEEEFTLYGIPYAGTSFNYLQPEINELKTIMRNVSSSSKNEVLGQKAREIIVEKYNEKTIADKMNNIIIELEKEPILRKNFFEIKDKLEEKGYKLFKEKNYDVAEKIFNNLAKFEKKVEYYEKLGISQYHLGKYDEAIFSLSLVIETGILNKEICLILADSLEKVGAEEEAYDFREKAKSL
ncbi:MAG: glycosyltransferase [Candidatus Sericytochromatia bacterium]